MYKVIAKRLLNAIPLLFVISIISFLLIKLAPGDPVRNFVTPNMSPIDVERIRKSLGLDQPIYMQYILWLKNIFNRELWLLTAKSPSCFRSYCRKVTCDNRLNGIVFTRLICNCNPAWTTYRCEKEFYL